MWIGADKSLSKSPLAFPGKVQVTGHVQVKKPDVNSTRIRLDTSGGLAISRHACYAQPTPNPCSFQASREDQGRQGRAGNPVFTFLSGRVH